MSVEAKCQKKKRNKIFKTSREQSCDFGKTSVPDPMPSLLQLAELATLKADSKESHRKKQPNIEKSTSTPPP